MKKSNVLKFSAIKDTDNIETVAGLNEVLKTWLESLALPWDAHSVSIENFEFKRRDGFIPHRHNCGGVDLFTCTDVASLIGSGEHFGLSIESWVDDQWNDANDEIAKQSPELHAKSDNDNGEFFDACYEYCSGDYSSIGWKVRAMYEGNGVLKIYAGYDKDAPYFREGLNDFETEIRFKTLSGLERQLNALTKKVEDSQNETQKKAKRA